MPLTKIQSLGITDSTIAIADFSATGTPSATTFLRGDNSWVAAGGANTPAFQAAFQNSDQTLSNNTNTKVVFSIENFDTNSRYDPTTNYRFTPVTTGKYFVYADIFPQTGAYSFDIMIYKNGAESFKQRIGGVSVDPISIGVHGIVDITLSTDYIEVYAWQNSGSSKIIYGSSAFGRFGAYKIIE